MKAKKMFHTIETHTLGQNTRNVVSGFAHIQGNTMLEKFNYMQNKQDWFRTLITCEPRGSEIMSGTLITEPCTPGTDVGVLYYESTGWLPMCGHDTIGVTVALLDAGMIDAKEPITYIKLDTAAGVIDVEAKVSDGVIEEVSFINAPAFVVKENITVDTEAYGSLTMDISWGGNLYAIIPANAIGIPIRPANANKFVNAARLIAKDINNQVSFTGLDFPLINEVTHVEFYGPSKNPNADIQNCVVALPSIVDRSPCGTGTSAKSAVLYNKGKLKVGESFIHESIIGSLFTCEIIEETTVAGLIAVRPKVTGNAYVSGYATWILDPKDPFPKGFLLG